MMIVLNTRESSKLVFKEAKKMLGNSRPAFYLSSLVAPSQRRERILRIKNSIKKNENPLIVTTQCIEAGVDIDIDYVIRDWAPLDSILQVCGRCNRNGLNKLGIVEILNLETNNGRAFSQTIYDDIKLDSTSFSLGEIGLVVEEASFYKLGTRYFDFVRKSNGESIKIVNAYAQYSHIYEEKGREIPVDIRNLLRDNEYQEQFIVSSLDPELIDDIQKALDIEDRWDRHYEIRSLRKRIASNSVSITFYKGMKIQPDDLTIIKIRNFRVLDEQFYDKDNVGLDINTRESLGGTLMFSD